ncbi:alpha/beta hydrolase family esterase [Nocardia arthritidis]|uniref:Phospholipase/carboxylesterase/thioesterase domain-containing protein n=1 Tax=Nocardia arthritidis TaxID=228602 RepID=A0A6G9YB93_9NOCA|nr:dienelactone hydrolase family protein [Nocardia arthritidis]QIS10535.1 hypothetical protein F5544_13230 [Nocardia arthritidis]
MRSLTELVDRRGAITHDGRRRDYRLVHAADPKPGAALVLVLHGTGETGDSIREFSNRAFETLAATGAAVIAYPGAVRREWNGARKAVMFWRGAKSVDDVGFLRALINELATSGLIDSRRVFVIGYSLGGQMTIRLLHDAPELLAGAALIACNQPAPDNLAASTKPPVPLPLLIFHGTADPVSPYSGGTVSLYGLFPKGGHLATAETAAYFAARNGIDTGPSFHWLPGGRVCRTEYRATGRPPVTLYSIFGGGHHIPGVSTTGTWLRGPVAPEPDTVTVFAEYFGLTI